MTDKEIIKKLQELLETMCYEGDLQRSATVGNALNLINRLQAENERLEYTLLGVMHSVDKWLDGAELEQDEVNRAVTMRENALRIVEGKQAEIERLNCHIQKLVNVTDDLVHECDCAKQEAIKDFAERLKERTISYASVVEQREVIDNLVKEMIGEQQ